MERTKERTDGLNDSKRDTQLNYARLCLGIHLLPHPPRSAAGGAREPIPLQDGTSEQEEDPLIVFAAIPSLSCQPGTLVHRRSSSRVNIEQGDAEVWPERGGREHGEGGLQFPNN